MSIHLLQKCHFEHSEHIFWETINVAFILPGIIPIEIQIYFTREGKNMAWVAKSATTNIGNTDFIVICFSINGSGVFKVSLTEKGMPWQLNQALFTMPCKKEVHPQPSHPQSTHFSERQPAHYTNKPKFQQKKPRLMTNSDLKPKSVQEFHTCSRNLRPTLVW